MLGSHGFARASYVLFAVAVLAALLKLGSVSDARPVVLQAVPAKPAAAAEALRDPLNLPGERGGPAGRALGEVFWMGGRLEGRSQTVDDAAVFQRPLPAGSPEEPICGDLGDFPASSRVVFPLPEEYFGSYEDTWGAPRPQGGHEGSDLMSPAGALEFAITDGTIVPAAGTDEDGWNRLGGYTVMLEAAYDVGPIRKGDLFYYAHLDRKSSLPPGTEVRAGQQIGVAGDTGEGPRGTRGLFPPHLHLGWYDAGGSRSKVESGAINPYPLLLWLEQNGGAVSGGADASSYCEAPQGPVPGPAPNSPGERPDLDTGNDRDARPSPVISENKPRHNHPSNHKNDAGQVQKPDGSEQVEKPDDSDQGEKPEGSGQAEQPDDGQQVEQPDNSGQVDEPDDSGQVEKPDDGEHEKPDDSGQDEKPDDNEQVENADDGAATGSNATTPEEPGEDGNHTARPAEDEKPRGDGVSRPRDLPRPGWTPSLFSIITSVFSQGESENPGEYDRGASQANSKQDERDSRKGRPEAGEPEDPPDPRTPGDSASGRPTPNENPDTKNPRKEARDEKEPSEDAAREDDPEASQETSPGPPAGDASDEPAENEDLSSGADKPHDAASTAEPKADT